MVLWLVVVIGCGGIFVEGVVVKVWGDVWGGDGYYRCGWRCGIS